MDCATTADISEGRDWDRPLQSFFRRQLDLWPEVRSRYEALARVETKPLGMLIAQHNPARIRSTGAKIGKADIAARPCFLCAHNRPPQQIAMPVGHGYDLLVNPYPILPMHFTIVAREHRPQTVTGVVQMIRSLVRQFPELTVFYNGPRCGASAPDHAHLQAGTTGRDGSWPLPIQRLWGHLDGYPVPFRLLGADEHLLDDDVNIVAWDDKVVVFPRSKHRPDCYGRLMVSPGALDMAGLIILPRREDYDSITAAQAYAILREVGAQPEREDVHG